MTKDEIKLAIHEATADYIQIWEKALEETIVHGSCLIEATMVDKKIVIHLRPHLEKSFWQRLEDKWNKINEHSNE